MLRRPTVMGLALLVVAGAVLDVNGPVAGVEVRVVELKPMACPCAPLDEEISPGNDVPDCHCSAALAMYRQRLAQCTWPAKALQVARTDKGGRVALDPRVLGHSIEAWTTSGIAWLDVPKSADRVGIELGPFARPRMKVDTGAELRAALLFDDGHCVPMQREAGSTWVAAAPVPTPVDSWPTLVVEAKGFRTVVRSWYEDAGNTLELQLVREQAIRGACKGDRVLVDNPLQKLAVPVSRGAFRVDGVIDSETTLTCMRGTHEVEAWIWTSADGLQEYGGLVGGSFGDECVDVAVTDLGGRPLANAEVSVFHNQGQSGGMSWGSGTSAMTDAHGKACVYEMYAGGELTVHPPAERGGVCAGEVKLKLTDKLLAKPIKLRVDVHPLTRGTWRGRLLTPEKLPVFDAAITVQQLEPNEVPGCSASSEVTVQSGPDGRFELPLMPQGKVSLRIGHDWYVPLDVDVLMPGPARELVLDRGITWTGNVLDASGATITRCNLDLVLPDGRHVNGHCGASGFTLRTVTPGDATLVITRLDTPRDAKPDERQLRQPIKIKPGKTLALDVTWPATSRKPAATAP